MTTGRSKFSCPTQTNEGYGWGKEIWHKAIITPEDLLGAP